MPFDRNTLYALSIMVVQSPAQPGRQAGNLVCLQLLGVCHRMFHRWFIQRDSAGPHTTKQRFEKNVREQEPNQQSWLIWSVSAWALRSLNQSVPDAVIDSCPKEKENERTNGIKETQIQRGEENTDRECAIDWKPHGVQRRKWRRTTVNDKERGRVDWESRGVYTGETESNSLFRSVYSQLP